MVSTTPPPMDAADRDTRAVETAKLDLIASNLRSSAVQIAVASVALVFAFDRSVTGFGGEITAWHLIWLAGQMAVAAAFVAVSRIWPPGAGGASRLTVYATLYFVSGAMWGALSWVAIEPGDIFNQVFVILVMICLSMIYIVRLTACTFVFLAACGGLFLVALPNCWVAHNELSTLMTFAAPAWLVLLGVASWRLGRQISAMIEMRLREGELVKRLSAAHLRAEQESASKSAFLANMSHELRTPLNAIIGFSDIMRSGLHGELSERYAAYAADIHASGEHLLSLINDLLDIAKIEAGRMQLAIEPVDVEDVAPQVKRLLQPRADEKGQTLTLSLGAAPAVIMADARALTQILLNLAGNAVKYTQAGGAIDIAIRAEGGDVVLQVSDNGPGISPEKQTRLFKPFERLDNSYLAGDAGTGLGLSLVRKLAALHGGEARIESAAGRGTTAIVRLPGAAMPSGGALAA